MVTCYSTVGGKSKQQKKFFFKKEPKRAPLNTQYTLLVFLYLIVIWQFELGKKKKKKNLRCSKWEQFSNAAPLHALGALLDNSFPTAKWIIPWCVHAHKKTRSWIVSMSKHPCLTLSHTARFKYSKLSFLKSLCLWSGQKKVSTPNCATITWSSEPGVPHRRWA